MSESTDLIKRKSSELSLRDEMPGSTISTAPPTRVASLVVWLFVCGIGLFGGLLAWSAVANIKGAVVALGKFEVEGDLQSVQHLEGGIIKEIRVREGDFVEKGDVIAILDDSRISAQTGILVNQLIGALSQEARLVAESQGAETLNISPELKSLVTANGAFASLVDAQQSLLQTNRQLDQGQLAIMQERISQIGEQINSKAERRKMLEQQLVLVRSELVDLQSLYDRQLVTKARLITRQKDETELLGDLRVIESDVAADRAQMAEIKQRMTQVQRDRFQQIAGDMQIVKEQVFELRERISAASDVGMRLSLRAPISGKVIDLSLNTVGAVIAPGETLMRIVPQDLPMVIVARVAPADIDEISIGGEARIRLLAYSYRKTPLVNGTVVDVSGDSMFDQAAGVSYYEILVRVDAESLAQVPDVKALPGMPAQVLVTTREQSIMAYILDPVLGGLETAMVQ